MSHRRCLDARSAGVASLYLLLELDGKGIGQHLQHLIAKELALLFGNAAFVLTMFTDAGDTAPQPQRNLTSTGASVCEWTLNQFDNIFHAHAKNNINALEIVSLKTPSKEWHAPTFHITKRHTNKMKGKPSFRRRHKMFKTVPATFVPTLGTLQDPCGKRTEPICDLNFFSMVTPVIRGLECCTYLMCLLHLLWMRIAASWEALLPSIPQCHPLLFSTSPRSVCL